MGAPTKEQVHEIQAQRDYWQNPDKQAKAAAMLERIRLGEQPPVVNWRPVSGGWVPE